MICNGAPMLSTHLSLHYHVVFSSKERQPFISLEWQDGYGAFTVSDNRRDAVRLYIRNQAEHHRSQTFQAEYLAFLRKAGVEFDERYLW
jgi:putative transposase